MNVFKQRFNSILFLFEHIFKVDHLKQVYLTKLTDDARKTSTTAVKTETLQLRSKFFIDSDFCHYIPQYDKHAFCEFSFMNVGFLSQQMFEGCPYLN